MEKNIIAIDGFIHIKSRKVMDNYQIILTFDDIFLVNSGNEYSKFVKSIFSGLGDLVSAVSGPLGVLSEIAGEFTGGKLSDVFKSFSNSKSKNKLEKLLQNLDEYAKNREDTEKIEFTDLREIRVKKGSILTGKSYIEFILNDKTLKLYTRKKEKIHAFEKAILLHPFSIKVVEKWF